jgi:hypothetical protein
MQVRSKHPVSALNLAKILLAAKHGTAGKFFMAVSRQLSGCLWAVSRGRRKGATAGQPFEHSGYVFQ